MGASLVAQMVKNLLAMQETRVQSLGREDPPEKGVAIHSSILAWRIQWPEEPGGLQSLGSQRIGHNWVTNTHCPLMQGMRVSYLVGNWHPTCWVARRLEKKLIKNNVNEKSMNWGSQWLIEIIVISVSPVTELDKQGFKIQVHFLLWCQFFQSSLGLQPHGGRRVGGIDKNEIELIAPVITSVLGIWVSTMTNNQLHLLFFLLGKLGLWLVSLTVAVLLAMSL